MAKPGIALHVSHNCGQALSIGRMRQGNRHFSHQAIVADAFITPLAFRLRRAGRWWFEDRFCRSDQLREVPIILASQYGMPVRNTVNPRYYRVFCTGSDHLHNIVDVDQVHKGIRGYLQWLATLEQGQMW